MQKVFSFIYLTLIVFGGCVKSPDQSQTLNPSGDSSEVDPDKSEQFSSSSSTDIFTENTSITSFKLSYFDNPDTFLTRSASFNIPLNIDSLFFFNHLTAKRWIVLFRKGENEEGDFVYNDTLCLASNCVYTPEDFFVGKSKEGCYGKFNFYSRSYTPQFMAKWEMFEGDYKIIALQSLDEPGVEQGANFCMTMVWHSDTTQHIFVQKNTMRKVDENDYRYHTPIWVEYVFVRDNEKHNWYYNNRRFYIDEKNCDDYPEPEEKCFDC